MPALGHTAFLPPSAAATAALQYSDGSKSSIGSGPDRPKPPDRASLPAQLPRSGQDAIFLKRLMTAAVLRWYGQRPPAGIAGASRPALFGPLPHIVSLHARLSVPTRRSPSSSTAVPRGLPALKVGRAEQNAGDRVDACKIPLTPLPPLPAAVSMTTLPEAGKQENQAPEARVDGTSQENCPRPAFRFPLSADDEASNDDEDLPLPARNDEEVIKDLIGMRSRTFGEVFDLAKKSLND